VWQKFGFFKTINLQFTFSGRENYELLAKSELLPNLDRSILAKYVVVDDPLDAAIALREKIKEMVN